MKFRDEEYYRAGLERIRQARVLYDPDDSYSLCIYCCGLAVECVLRAFKWRIDPSFDGRHDLDLLLKASGLLRVDEDYMRQRGKEGEEIRAQSLRFRSDMNEVVLLWHNDLRFASERRLKTHLLNIGRVQGVKGDPLKKNALDMLEASQRIIDRGVVLWTS